MELEIMLEPAKEGGYVVTCPMLKGCVSEGDTKDEALINIQEAIGLYLRALKKEEQILLDQNHQIELLKVAVNA